MVEFDKFYTVEDIANMTNLTSRTIRNYLKDGSLEGKKIGGQWRFTMKDIEKLFNNGNVTKDIKDNKKQQVMDFIDGINTDMKGKIQICSIVDFYCDNENAAKEMSDKLIVVINNDKNATKDCASYSYEYIKKESKARFTLFGNSDFIINTLTLLKD